MTDRELQLRLLYAVIVAGKSARFAERAMVRLFAGLGDGLPFGSVRTWIADGCLEAKLRDAGTGNYGKISKAFQEIVAADMDLRNCHPKDLELIYGVGPKTARFFIIWTRPDAQVAALDVHVLRWLRSLGYDAPHQTPSRRKYAELEAVFLMEADKRGLTPHQLDAAIWSAGSKRDQEAIFESLSDLVGARDLKLPTAHPIRQLPEDFRLYCLVVGKCHMENTDAFNLGEWTYRVAREQNIPTECVSKILTAVKRYEEA